MSDQIKSVVCILSYQRTGSSLLQEIINTNKKYSIVGEIPNVVTSMCDYIFNLKCIDSALVYDKNNNISKNKKSFINKNIDIKNLIKINSHLFISEVLQPSKEIEVIGWKENNIQSSKIGDDAFYRYIDQMIELFPNIKFIVNIRNPVDTSESAMWRTNKNSLIELQKNYNFLKNLNQYKKIQKHSVIVDYDQWSSNPELLINSLEKIDLKLDYDKVYNLMQFKFNHLKIW